MEKSLIGNRALSEWKAIACLLPFSVHLSRCNKNQLCNMPKENKNNLSPIKYQMLIVISSKEKKFSLSFDAGGSIHSEELLNRMNFRCARMERNEWKAFSSVSLIKSDNRRHLSIILLSNKRIEFSGEENEKSNFHNFLPLWIGAVKEKVFHCFHGSTLRWLLSLLWFNDYNLHSTSAER